MTVSIAMSSRPLCRDRLFSHKIGPGWDNECEVYCKEDCHSENEFGNIDYNCIARRNRRLASDKDDLAAVLDRFSLQKIALFISCL